MTPDTWILEETEFDPDLVPRNETLFALSNGYIGIRGDFEEGDGNFHPGTYVNGFYEIRPIEYGESAYGYAKFHQTIQNTANPKLVKVRVNGTLLSRRECRLLEYRRRLDFRTGTLERSMVLELPSRQKLRYRSRRFVSLADPFLMAMEIEITPLDSDSSVVFESYLDGGTTNRIDFGDPRVAAHTGESKKIISFQREGNAVGLTERTRLSRIAVASGITHSADRDPQELVALPDDRQPGTATIFRVSEGETVTFRKFAYIRLVPEGDEADLTALMNDLRSTAERGFDILFSEHKEHLNRFWRVSDVRIDGNPEVQRKVRYSLFQLYQAGRFLIDSSVPAKGLTSEGYEGHFFWDTEIFIMPFFTFTQQKCAREILRNRYRMLDAARARARELAEKGALFPWRTINGQEASAYFLAGTAQYHINAAIAYAIRQYVAVTGDYEYLLDEGAEMLFETARAWVSLGFFNQAKGGRFCINGVTGPDEYTALVNNNCYTNMMARFHLRYAREIYYWMAEEHFEQLQRVSGILGLQPDEVDTWMKAAEGMHIPYDPDLGIHLQDDDILAREPWDFENTPRDRYPLLLNFHPLVIYRHRVLKQPDMLMTAFLLPEEFSDGEHLRAYEFYTPITTFDSSLGAPVQAIISAREGRLREAWKFFKRNLNVDLEDIQGNVRDGLHMAATGGTWQSLVFGFGGLKIDNGEAWFEPHLPREINGLEFRLRLKESLVSVSFDRKEARYELEKGEEISLRHEYETITLVPGIPVSRSLVPELKSMLIYLAEPEPKSREKVVRLLENLESLGIRTVLCGASEIHPLKAHTSLFAGLEEIVKNVPDPEPFFTGATVAEEPLRNCMILSDHEDAVVAAGRAGLPCYCLKEPYPENLPSASALIEEFRKFHRL